LVPIEDVAVGAIGQDTRDRRAVELEEALSAERGRVIMDLQRVDQLAPGWAWLLCHQHRGRRGAAQVPTSARIAPGPSSVLPRPSCSAPTRIAIFPWCLFSRISW